MNAIHIVSAVKKFIFAAMKNEVQEQIDLGLMLPTMEEFYTLQGEGFFKGTAAYFIRLGGCDVGCHWCDVKESWDAILHPPKSIDELVENAKKNSGKSRLVVVTGGEPLMYNLDPLTDKLKAEGFKTNIETSGAHPMSGHWDWVCLSPKKRKLPTPAAYRSADEIKMIVFNNDDFRFAEEQAAQVKDSCIRYLQPEWGKRDKMMPQIVDYVMQNPQWKVSLQTHKYLNIP